VNIHSLNQKQAAALLSTTPRSLRDWEAAGQGLPRNPDGTYPGPALVAWYVARETGEELDPSRERARKDKEAADKLAMENAETRGDLGRVSVMEREIASLLADHRQNALALPTKLAPALKGLDEERIRARIEDAVYELLGDLADYRPGGRAGGDPAGAAARGGGGEAPAEADDKPVGRRAKKAVPRK
jgi:hypothetical protein